MKAWLPLSAWLLLGLAVGLRRSAPPWERLLAVVFWPFFLMAESSSASSPASSSPSSPSSSTLSASASLSRLRRAMGPDEHVGPFIQRLERALAAHASRVARLEEEISGLQAQRGGAPVLVEARARSLESIEQALRQERESLAGAEALIEESATRLLLVHEGGRLAAVGPLMDELVGLLEARAEVERTG